jgi:hypothetical protein
MSCQTGADHHSPVRGHIDAPLSAALCAGSRRHHRIRNFLMAITMAAERDALKKFGVFQM